MAKRKLNEKEIASVLRWLEPSIFRSRVSTINEQVAASHREVLSRQLRLESFEVTDTRLEKLARILEEQFMRALVEYGYPAGKIAGTSAGEIATQLTLKAAKGQLGASASGKSRNMMTAFKQLVGVSQTPTQQRIEIRFKNPYSLTELYLMRKYFQSLRIIVDLQSVEIASYDKLYEDWYELFYEIYGEESNSAEVGMRIRFDSYYLYEYQISLSEIASRLETQKIIIIFSPQALGIMDIYPKSNYESDLSKFEASLFETSNFEESPFATITKTIGGRKRIATVEEVVENAVEYPEEVEYDENGDIIYEEVEGEEVELSSEGEPDEEIEELIDDIEEEQPVKTNEYIEFDKQAFFLRSVILPMIGTFEFGGNENIPLVEIDWIEIRAVVEAEKKINDDEYLFIISEKVVVEKGVTVSQLLSLLRKIGWIQKNLVGFNLTIVKNPNFKGKYGTTPFSALQELSEDASLYDETIIPFLTSSTGFEFLISLPGVDISRSYTDSVYLMKEFFGIEASYRTIFNEIQTIFSDEYSLSPVNATIICSFMCFTGEPVAMTRFGAGKLGGPLTQASFERPLFVLRAGALHGVTEPRTVMTALIQGQRPPIGTGVVEEPHPKTPIEYGVGTQRYFQEDVDC